MEEEINKLIEALEESLLWVRASLDCPDWRWDSGQREAAEQTYENCRNVVCKMRGLK